MKKLLCVLLVFALCFAIPLRSARAASAGDLRCMISDGQVTITYCNPSAKGQLFIPSKMAGYPVTKIGDNAFSGCSYLTSVSIPESVTAIGEGAFRNCYKMESVTIPDNVTDIGKYAFYNCDALYAMTIPDSVTAIGEEAFSYCSNLITVIIGKEVMTIGAKAFYSCSNLISVTIPKGVTTIGDEAFCNCLRLKSMSLPEGVTTIGVKAFYMCYGLNSVTIPESVTAIGEGAFYECNSLKTVYFVGNAPEILVTDESDDAPFSGIKRTVYYHADTKGWDEQTRQAFGDNLTWVQTEHEYHGGVCIVCGFGGPQPCNHSYTNGEWVTKPTCTEAGQECYTCTACGYMKYVTAEATGHSLQITEVAPGCTEEGYRLQTCENCDYSYTDNILSPVGHHYENGVCTVCGIPLIGDVSGDGQVDILDVARLYAHIKQTDIITDPVALKAADYTGDQEINILDAAKLYAHVQGA